MFTDDTLLLSKASIEEANTIKRILNLYEQWSGQCVSVQKSTIFFSSNVDAQIRGIITRILGMPEVPTHGKNMGLSTSIGASKKEVFKSVMDRIRTKVDTWKPRLLSRKQIKRFSLHQCYSQSPTLHAVLQTTYSTKDEGGLGFRKAQDFNNALLCKKAWRLLTDPSSTLALTYKTRYFPNGSFLSAELGTKPGNTWRILLSVCELVNKGTKWDLGNGKSINVWKKRWVNHTHSNMLITPCDADFKDLMVSNLIDEVIVVWKVDLSSIHNRLATTDNLIKRHVQILDVCQICESMLKNIMHVFHN
ncbi:hypothetical protein LIER_42110 [Lithospermum erythrorhizon]|uniref:Reverse transcriptase n=1 Tax=Lithospermum erythrorhizon TaxID=34254 RepID=A0AAV3RL72_LITER